MTRRWSVLAALILVLAAAAAHALAWRWAAGSLQTGFDAWVREQRARGWTVRAGPTRLGGWPLAATLAVRGLSVEGGEGDLPGGLAWSAEHVSLTIRLLQPGTLRITPDGNEGLRLSTLPVIPFTADRLQVAVPLEAGNVPSHAATLEAANLRAGVPPGRAGEAGGGLTVGVLTAHADARPGAPQGEPVLAFAAGAEAIVLPPGFRWALGARISSLEVQGALDGPLPRTSAVTRRAASWRDGGGTLDISRLALAWGPLGLDATATLALDMRLQPMGAGNARLAGYAETLDALVAGGVIGRRTATAVSALAALIARTPEGGGPAEVEVPLTLQDRTLSLRQIPLLRLPELPWPPE